MDYDMSPLRRKTLLFIGASVAAIIAATKAFAGTYSAFNITNTKGSASAFLDSSPSATTSISMADRFAQQIFNVKAYGAVGDGSHDDTTNIQNAINALVAAGGGVLFFPLGTSTYNITAKLTSTTDIIYFEMLGAPGAAITGNFNNFLFERLGIHGPIGGIHVIRNLRFTNNHATGKGIRFGSSVSGLISNCPLSAYQALWTFESQSVLVQSCAIIGPTTAGSVGIMAGNATTVDTTDISGYDHGIRHQNVGLCVHGGRMESNNAAIVLGQDESGANFQTTGYSITAVSMEANLIGILVSVGTTGFIGGMSISGGISMTNGIYLVSSTDTLISGINIGGTYTSAGIKMDNAVRVVFEAVNVNITGTLWILPSDPSGLDFVSCLSAPAHPCTLAQAAAMAASIPTGSVRRISNSNTATLGGQITTTGANDVMAMKTDAASNPWRVVCLAT